jgi:hypothetical protein
MRRAAPFIACLLLLVVLPGAAQAHQAHRRAAAARQPVVVELFTSQGCSACVAADKLLDQLADRPGVLALTFAVDYWDYLGWNDTYAKPEFSARQKAYMQRQSLRDLYTPQVIIDGKGQAAGAEPKKIDASIDRARRARTRAPPMRFVRRSHVQIGPGHRPEGGAEVWLIRYDPALHTVKVKRGENRGQTLAQRNVVRELVRLGAWSGKRRSYALPATAPGDSGLKTCILLQMAKGGRILGVLQR